MAEKHFRKNILLLINQSLVIAFLVLEVSAGVQLGLSGAASCIIITVLFALAVYIGLSNLNGGRVLTSFSGLLVLVGWSFLLNLDEGTYFSDLSDVIIPVIIYEMITFLICFIFQDGVYPQKKKFDSILLICVLLPIILKLFDDRWFALAHLSQYVVSFLCCVFILITQRKRVCFFIESEWKNLLPSIGIFCAVMVIYIALFRNEPSYLENSGMFLIICLPLWSVFKVAYQSKETVFKYMSLNTVQIYILIILVLAASLGITVLFSLGSIFLLLAAQIVLWFFMLYHLFMIWNITKKTVKPLMEYQPYLYTLSQIEKEEDLKKQFSDFLHDEVLQDLLAVKNLMSKSERPEVRQLINETLDKLNRTVREEMQDYHSVILNNLTLKVNYQNLLSELAQKFYASQISVDFDCPSDLFLVMPYPLAIYRAMRELVTNAYKHSNCTNIHVTLTQKENNIELTVKDNGNSQAAELQRASKQHQGKGLLSLKELAASLGGQLDISDNIPQGVYVRLSLQMKGDGSYQYFAHR